MPEMKRTSDNYLYTTWLAMIYRCTNPEHRAWKWYGARGIKVCRRWLNSFEAFVADMGERPTAHHSLDRTKNDKGYSPSNCRWATRREQALNRRVRRPSEKWIKVDGLTLREFAKKHGLNHGTLKHRYKNGKRGADLLAEDLRDGSAWRGKRRDPSGKMIIELSGEVVAR